MPPRWVGRQITDNRFRQIALTRLMAGGFRGLMSGQGRMLQNGEVNQAFPYWAYMLSPGRYRLEHRYSSPRFVTRGRASKCTVTQDAVVRGEQLAELSCEYREFLFPFGGRGNIRDHDRLVDFDVPPTPGQPYTPFMIDFYAYPLRSIQSRPREPVGETFAVIGRESFTTAETLFSVEDGTGTDFRDLVFALRKLS